MGPSMPKNIFIEADRISDWASFHDTFAEILGFPDFYGRNMDAWIDCMTCLDDADAGMTSTHVTRGDFLVLCISSVESFKRRCPEVYDALVECSAFVNHRRIDNGEPAILALSFVMTD